MSSQSSEFFSQVFQSKKMKILEIDPIVFFSVEFQQKYHHHRPPTHYVVYWRIEGSPTANEQETEASEMKLNYLQPKAK